MLASEGTPPPYYPSYQYNINIYKSILTVNEHKHIV